ncbi:MAG: DUF4215 domain-containing protein [Proteobacteria bacterium]|nr:DUF4215 domain-containing protein [Pseudomonadota bacterium]
MKKNRVLLILLAASLCGLSGCSGDDDSFTYSNIVAGPCGDGIQNLGEACDDGNTNNGDGCSSECKVELNCECKDFGQPCECSGKVEPNPENKCGNGVRESGEECDDGNLQNGDGCPVDCSYIEDGYGCPPSGGACWLLNPPEPPPEDDKCGDYELNEGEQCDDGGKDDGDGCSSTCQIEDGWMCPDYSNCVKIGCGDGYVNNGEACDPTAENNIQLEYDFEPGTGGPIKCTSNCELTPYCGDGTVQNGHEKCDNGNKNSAVAYGQDACTDKCTPAPYCGDGHYDHQIGENIFEDCDYADPQAGEGCTKDCKEKEGWKCSALTGACVKSNVDDPDPPVEPPAYVPACNNGTLDSAEECDDTSKAGCQNDCKAASGYKCIGSSKKCTTDCTGSNVECTKILYGNGKIDKDGYEQCDDGNTTDGDGCSKVGLIEPGYKCPTAGQPCVAAACGDGIRVYGEECDDGNSKNGDGCSARCRIEDHAICSSNTIGSKSSCKPGTCGDSKIGKNEQCDNGSSNGSTGNKCSAMCHIVNRVTTKCGNGTIDTANGEECDDGNKLGGDGCSPTCQIESAFECYDNGKKNICRPICGDGITMWMLNGDAAEECDDGNNISGDGCSADCRKEPGFTCTDFKNVPYPDTISLPVTYRDFRGRDLSGSGNGYMSSTVVTNLKKDSSCNRTPQTSDSITDGVVKWSNIQPLSAGYGHPDFENFKGNLCFGIAKDQLGEDGKPVFSGDVNASCCGKLSATECKAKGTAHNSPQYRTIATHLLCGASFNTWFRTDDAINKEVSANLLMEKTGKDTYVFDSQFPPQNSAAIGGGGVRFDNNPAYFNPLVNAGFKDHRSLTNILCYDANNSLIDCNKLAEFNKYNIQNTYTNNKWTGNKLASPYTVNGGFTTEIQTYFQYKPTKAGEKSSLNFTGDDDVWVFINGKLFVDLGGMHSRASETGTLTAASCSNGQLCDADYGVYEGGVYDMRIFNAERAYSGSNFKLTLTGFINSGKSVCQDKCGDKIVSSNEECDEGTNSTEAEFKGCSTSCKKKSKCGNGIVESGEQCDNGFLCKSNASLCNELGTSYNSSIKCNDSCKFTGSECGNNKKEGAEECDGTDVPSGKHCLATCRISVCGDGVIDKAAGEECDNGKNNGLGSCTKGCTKSRCGDGVVDEYNGEVCDDGINDGKYGHCGIGCTYRAPYCGDGVIQTNEGEVCDDGVNDGSYKGCMPGCKKKAPYCGDINIDTEYGEACDDGPSGSSSCTPTCQKPIN